MYVCNACIRLSDYSSLATFHNLNLKLYLLRFLSSSQFTFPRHGDLFELLLPLYEDVKETLEKKNEQLYVFINDGAAANDSFTVELKTLDARLPAAESSRVSIASSSRVTHLWQNS